MAKIIISEFMDQAAVDTLAATHDVHLDETLCDRPEALTGEIGDASALIVRNRTQVTKELITAAPHLKAVGRLGVGLDNIDLTACKARNIAVLPATGANAASVAEYVIAAALMLLRGPVFFGTGQLQAGSWPRAEMSKGREIAGKTLGVIGFGSIGQTTARLANATGFQTIAHDEFLSPADPAWTTTKRVTFEQLLHQADIVTLHCPLDAQTRNLIAAPQLAAMRPGTILINTARGGIVHEQALTDALRTGHLGGAAIDVFATEPIDRQTADTFVNVPNLILTPHVAGVTQESNQRISSITADNILRVLMETAT
ncbi:MAG: hydroxyacid dehydrogenase [Alphaproteobacteria bacterium]|nr:hydroxyacid dehydrogenase [Alphaproteobacteria bacterium]